MSSTTVDTIQSRIAGIVDQDEDSSAIDSSDYSLRLNYINRREKAWSEIGNWQCLYKEYNTLTSTNSGNTSIALPSDFRRLASFPKITYDGVTTEEFSEIQGQQESQYDSVTDHYCKILGNDNAGYYLVVNPGSSSPHLASGASIYIPYFLTPTSHTSPSNVVYCPNPEYLVQGAIADIWEAREDARFQQAKIEANLILQNMLMIENTPSQASANDVIRTRENSRWGFRAGRD